MADAATTRQAWTKDVLDTHKLFALIDQHNQGVIDDHKLLETLDGEEEGDGDYEDVLTALEVGYVGYVPTGTATTPDLPVNALTEETFRKLIEQHNARVVDIRAIVTKLNEDGDITASDYASTALEIQALGVEANDALDRTLIVAPGEGVSGRLLQAIVDQHAALTQDWHDIAAKLDADSVLSGSYEENIAAQVLSEWAEGGAAL